MIACADSALSSAATKTVFPSRLRVLILSIGSYALFGFLAGCAQSYEQLLVCLTLQGLGFGGEWAAGAVLVAEYAQATQRGRVVGAVQSAWSVGYGAILIANTLAFSLAPPDLAWRVMFWLGVVPAVVLLARHGQAARKMGIPFGPFLGFGGLVGLFFGEAILDAYLGLL